MKGTQALILHYLETVEGERTAARICAYMGVMHGRTKRATLVAISRLHVAGKIVRVGVGRYQRLAAGGGAANNSTGLTTHYRTSEWLMEDYTARSDGHA